MSNVVDFNGFTTHDISPDKVLSSAVGKLDTVLIIGLTEENEAYVASSTTVIGDIFFLLAIGEDQAKKHLPELGW